MAHSPRAPRFPNLVRFDEKDDDPGVPVGNDMCILMACKPAGSNHGVLTHELPCFRPDYFTKMGRGIKNGLERKVKKGKQLAAIGAGAEDHNADEVTKAMGIDAAGDYFQQPVAPAQNHIDEANQAGIEQTKDGYTNVPTISVPTPPA